MGRSVCSQGKWVENSANWASKRRGEDRGDDDDRGNTSTGDDADRIANRECHAEAVYKSVDSVWRRQLNLLFGELLVTYRISRTDKKETRLFW